MTTAKACPRQWKEHTIQWIVTIVFLMAAGAAVGAFMRGGHNSYELRVVSTQLKQSIESLEKIIDNQQRFEDVPDTLRELKVAAATPTQTTVEVVLPRQFNDRIPSEEEMLSLESCEERIESGAMEALPSRDDWISEFRRTKRIESKKRPLCEACGRSADEVKDSNSKRFGQIDMHHKVSVKEIIEGKLDRSLLTDPKNMIMLCRDEHGGCHLKCGHTVNGVSSWTISNPHVERTAKRSFAKSHPGETYEDLVDEWRAPKPLNAPVPSAVTVEK